MASSIASFYKIFFLYIDPLICLSGIYLSFLDQTTYILHGIPKALLSSPPSTSTASPIDLTPLAEFLLHTIGALFLFFFVIQTILLRQSLSFPARVTAKVWKSVMFGILMTDLAMIYAAYYADPTGLTNVSSWGSEEWGNYGVLGGLVTIRIAFLLGIGN